MSSDVVPAIYRHTQTEAYGKAIFLQERNGNHHFLFEDGKVHIISKDSLSMMAPLQLSEQEALELDARIRQSAVPAAVPRKLTQRKGKKVKPELTTQMSFEEEVKRFLTLFPDGFQGKRFIVEERGTMSPSGNWKYKEKAMRSIQEKLGPDAPVWNDPEKVFKIAQKLTGDCNLVVRFMGQQQLATLKAADRPSFASALHALLHGSGDYGSRLDAFIATLRCSQPDGTPWFQTWQFVSYYPAIYHPSTHIAVSPLRFVQQSIILGLPEPRAYRPWAGADYDGFLRVGQETHRRLLEAGLEPRDLMDTYSFIWRMLGKNEDPLV